MAVEPNPSEARLREIFTGALEQPPGEQRRVYLEDACGGDARLRARAEALLRAHAQVDGILDRNAHGEDINLEDDAVGTVIGSYRLVERLGTGGFGVVYRAEQIEPMRREVALKIIKLGMDTREVIARFEAERQALALMHHPNIAQVFDAGATDTGRPYFVMELVPGKPITEYCDAEQLATAERLRLFLQVCEGVQHAHRKGIVHRDLKPSNVVIMLQDGKPVPKIIDFGIAKVTQSREATRTRLTRRELLLGTPAYMSPEQVELSGQEIDERSDIYSLGVLLYELLTGAPPFETETLHLAAIDEVRRIIREEDPPTPSTKLQTLGERAAEVARRRRAEPVALSRQLKGDLDWIVMKALEKDHLRRYDTADTFGDDLRRHLEHRPVRAGPPGLVYRLQKLARRRRGALMTTGSVAAVLMAAALLGYWQAKRTREAERRAASSEAQLDATGSLPLDAQARGLVAGIAHVQPEASLSPDETMLAYVDWDGPDGDLLVRDLKTGHLTNLTQSEKHLPGKYEMCPDVHVWSPDSKTLAYLWASAANKLSQELRLVSVTTGEIRTLKAADPAVYYRPQDWSAGGRQLLCEKVESKPKRKSLVLVDVASAREQAIITVSGEHARLSGDGRFVVLAQRTTEAESEPKKTRSDVYLVEIGSTNLQRLTFAHQASGPIWAPREPVVLFSGDQLGSWDLWGVRLENGRPASGPFPVRYGIGSFDKRLTHSGRLIVHRKVTPGDGYTIAEGAPRGDVAAIEAFPGRIYLESGGRLHTLTSEAGQAAVRPVGTRGVPSRQLHGGRRWFLQARPAVLPPETNSPTEPLHFELVAVTLEGTVERAVRLVSAMPLGSLGNCRWAADYERRLADGRISWTAGNAGRADPGAPPPGLYSAQAAFDSGGRIAGLERLAIEPLVPAAENHDWSPDGRQVVYELRNGPVSELHILDLPTRQSRKLADGSTPVWSPDGSRIAFRGGYKAIHSIQPDGSGLRTMARREPKPGVKETVPVSGYYELVWAPDSAALLFSYFDLGADGKEVFRIGRDGGEASLVTRSVLDSAVPVAWLPEGGK